MRRIRAGALGRFRPIPLRELRDTQVGIGEIWARAGVELTQRVAEARGSEVRVGLIEEFLLRRLAKTSSDPIVERALHFIYRRSDAIAVAALAEHSPRSVGATRPAFRRAYLERRTPWGS